jgi:hypothetical protein
MNLRSLTASLNVRKRRLKELIEICGGFDETHPLQKHSMDRISKLEKEIEKFKKPEA